MSETPLKYMFKMLTRHLIIIIQYLYDVLKRLTDNRISRKSVLGIQLVGNPIREYKKGSMSHEK